MKVGRNNPCPCGSGKKYKRCHLDTDKRRESITNEMANAVMHDLPTIRMVVAAQKPGFVDEVIAPADALNVAFREEIAEGLEGQAAAEALELYLGRVEAAMAEIAAKHSRGYWMYLTRRLPPKAWGSATDWTVRLYRRVLTLAVIKHGEPAVGDDEFTVLETKAGPAQVPADLNHDAIVDAFALEYLAFEYTTASQSYRRVGKGARLEVAGDDFRAVADEALEDLLQDIDRRVREYGELTGIYGAAADRDFPNDLEPGDATPLAVLATVPNSFGIPPDKAMRSKNITVPGPTNFLAVPLVIDGYRETLGTLATEFESALGVSPELFLAAVWGLSMYLVHGIEATPTVEVQLLKTGYLMSKRDTHWDGLVGDVSHWAAALIEYFGHPRPEPEEARRLIESGLGALTWTEDAISGISLWDRLPFNLILDAGDFYLVDYSALMEMFADVFRQVGFLDGDSGNVKAANFEAAVAARARAEGIEPWKDSSTLRHQDGTEREIDVGLVSGDTLFVVECKAYAQNPKIDRGDWGARLNRQDQLNKFLGQARTLAEFIDEEHNGRNYDVPSVVTRVEPMVCTPSVEFIWSRDEDLWVNKDIPRICTVDELMLLVGAAAAS